MVNVSQLVREVDLLELEPIQVYESVQSRNSYILESAEGGEKTARYSFIGFNPALLLKIKNEMVEFNAIDSALKDLKPVEGDPLSMLRGLSREFEFTGGAPARFTGGFVGYFSYDLVRHYIKLDQNTVDELKQPDAEFMLARNNIIFDHVERKTYVTANVFNGNDAEKEDDKLDAVVESLMNLEFKEPMKDREARGDVDFQPNMTQHEFEENVRKAKDYIKAGDIFQVVLSQRLSTEFNGDSLHVYRRLRQINPSPYMYYLDFLDRDIVGSSPEMLTRVDGKIVSTYPIAGTRPRGKTPREDNQLEQEMLADKKERAEHVMLVDLGRNDIGRVSRYGSVKVGKFMGVEKYSHVQHIVSEVTGKLQDGKDEFDALESIFPAGTVSGAPKVRAMEIIDELEPSRRGVYAGCVGYFSFNRNMDTAITIRTLVFEKKSKTAYAQAGAGIVADSQPTSEYHETISKAKAMLNAVRSV